MARKPDENVDQLDLFGPEVESWFEVVRGGSTVWVIADDAEEAKAKAEAELREMGFLPGGPPGLHESWLRMCEFARRGRR
jgi:hypothetical protein